MQLVGGRGWGLGAPIKVKRSSKEGVERLELEPENIISNGSRSRTFMLFPLDVQLEKQGLWEDPMQFWKSGPLLCQGKSKLLSSAVLSPLHTHALPPPASPSSHPSEKERLDLPDSRLIPPQLPDPSPPGTFLSHIFNLALLFCK